MAVWDVAARPAREQFGYWREVICEAFVPLSPAPVQATDGFHSRVETRPLEQVVRARLASQPQRTSHGAREVVRTDGEYVFVNLQTAGTCAVEQGGRRALVAPGRFTVVDTTEPYHFDFDRSWAMVSYRIPHAMFGGRMGDVRRLTAGSWGAAGAGGVVGAVMASMWDLHATAGTPDVEHALVSAVAASGAEQAGVADDHRAALRAAIERHVERRLSDPSLSVGTVSREIGVSPRTLHTVVSAGGETFAAMVRRRRLERAALLLAEPGGRASVTEIAARVGFDGPSSFSRAFRRRFGRSPTEMRHSGPPAARTVQRDRTN